MGRQPGLSIKVKDKIHPSTGHESLGREEVGGQCHAPPALPPGKRHSTHLHESRWAPGPVWTGADNLAPLGFDHRTFKPVASHMYLKTYITIKNSLSHKISVL